MQLDSECVKWSIEYSKNKKVYVDDLFDSQWSNFFKNLSTKLDTFYPRQLLWHVVNQNLDIIRCNCGSPVKWIRNNQTYRVNCSPQCAGIKSRKPREKKKPLIPWYLDPIKKQQALEKRRQRCYEKYGVYSHQQRPDVKQKTQNTNLERYGHINPFGNVKVKQKASDTFKKKYQVGTENHLNLIEKRKKTNQQRYGVDHPMQNEEIKSLQHETMLKKYGVEHALLNKNINDKRKSTNLKKYGNEEAVASEQVKNKIIESNKEKWGTDNWTHIIYSDFAKQILFDRDNFNQELSGMTLDQAKVHLGVSLRTILNYAEKYNLRNIFDRVKITNQEQKIKDLLDSIVGDQGYVQNSKSIIPPYELDFYVPAHNLAIEINGLYWHSELGGGKRNRSYHKTKWKKCKEQNITLLMFNDCDIKEKFHLIESKIKRHLKIPSPVIGARKLEINKCDDFSIEEEFLNQWHIQGSTSNRNISFVAKYNQNIVGIATWKYKNSHAELVRFATDVNYSFPGLLSKMIKEFIRYTDFKGTILSYSNNQYGDGKAYVSSGFQYNGITPPGYSYTKDYTRLESRLKFQKHKLLELFDLEESVIDNNSEWQIMQSYGYDRIWDCGHTRWIINID